MLILLTSEEADAVRGPSETTPSAALQPIVLTDGRYILGTEVLSDPAHAKHWALLASLPTCEVEEIAQLLPGLGA